MKKIIIPVFVFSFIAGLLLSCGKPAPKAETIETPLVNDLTESEKADGWQLLFNGQNFDGWKRYGADSIGPLWSVKDGVIVCSGEGLTEGTKDIGGSLMTTRQFGNFDLSVEWKIVEGGNSGILYHVIEKPEYKTDYATGPEYQVMDDIGWKGDSLRPEQMVGSNYDMYAAPATKKVSPVGEWNVSRIVYNNGHVEHYLNGEKTVEFDEGSDDFVARYKKSKWVDFPGWNQSKVGAISLQDHGANVYFRSIKIKELK
jgi:Domain of Unknown Function (DUF1080)